MRCCSCANGCEVSTTNLGEGGTEDEKAMDLDGSAGDRRDDLIRVHWRRAGDASLELAAAAAVRLAANYVLAGAWTAAALPDLVRGAWCSRLASFQYAFQDETANGRAVGADDAGRTRKGSRALEALRIRAAGGQADGVSAAGEVGQAQARKIGSPEGRFRGKPWFITTT